MKDKLLSDYKKSIKEKDTIAKSTIQLLRSAIINKEKENKEELNNIQIEDIVIKEIKKREDSLKIYKERNIISKIEEIEKEINILNNYAPKQLTLQEVENIIKKLKNENNIESLKDMGLLIKLSKQQIGNKSSGKIISDIVKSILT